MSVLIRGMEMPTSCLECVFYRKTDPVYDYCCISSAVPKGYVPNDCPLVPVPPHGRLIDADAPISLVDTRGKNIEVTIAHIIEENFGVVNAIIEAEEDEHDV